MNKQSQSSTLPALNSNMIAATAHQHHLQGCEETDAMLNLLLEVAMFAVTYVCCVVGQICPLVAHCVIVLVASWC